MFFPKINAYRSFDKNKCMYFLRNEDRVFDTFNDILEKASNRIKKSLIENLYTIKKSRRWRKNQHKRKLSMFL